VGLVLPIQRGGGVVKDVEYVTKEINSEGLPVRISLLPPCTEVFSFGPRGVVLQLFKSTMTRGQAPVDFPLEIPPPSDNSPRPDVLLVAHHPSRPRFPSIPTPRSKSRPLPMHISNFVDHSLYESRNTRARSLTILDVPESRRRRCLVFGGHPSPDEDGEGRKSVGPLPRPHTVANSLGV